MKGTGALPVPTRSAVQMYLSHFPRPPFCLLIYIILVYGKVYTWAVLCCMVSACLTLSWTRMLVGLAVLLPCFAWVKCVATGHSRSQIAQQHVTLVQGLGPLLSTQQTFQASLAPPPYYLPCVGYLSWPILSDHDVIAMSRARVKSQT